ncbi:hypothetical protein ACLOJK_006712 [Asimina triloba]
MVDDELLILHGGQHQQPAPPIFHPSRRRPTSMARIHAIRPWPAAAPKFRWVESHLANLTPTSRSQQEPYLPSTSNARSAASYLQPSKSRPRPDPDDDHRSQVPGQSRHLQMDNKQPSSSARVIDDGKSQITRSSFISPSAAPLFLFLNPNADDEAADEAMASGIHPVTRKQLPRHSWPASRREQMQRPRSSMAIDPGQ